MFFSTAEVWSLSWHPNEGPDLWSSVWGPLFGVHFWGSFLGPFLGFISGFRFLDPFWGPFLGFIFGVHFWIPFWNPFLGPNFWDHFWVQILDFGVQFLDPNLDPFLGSRIWIPLIFNREPFLGAIFGVQKWAQIWHPEIVQKCEKSSQIGYPEGAPGLATKMLQKCLDLAHETEPALPKQDPTLVSKPSQTQPRVWPQNLCKFDIQKGSRSGTPKGVCVATDKGCHMWRAWEILTSRT